MYTSTQHPNITRTMICPHCLQEYELGLTGTVNGCDKCEGIVRLPSGMIDYKASSPEMFISQTGQAWVEIAIGIGLIVLIAYAFYEIVKLVG